jgi:hypothetical protein
MVTATRDRQRDPQSRADALAEWGQRSVFGNAKGWPWWAAVVLALGLSIIGAVIDMNMSGNLGRVYEGAYFLGCVAAVCLVRRRNVFGPMVQAPLILAVTIPIVVLLTKGLPSTGGTMSKLITLGVPLVTGFPTMAITTGATVLIGCIRYLVQRKPAGVDADDEDDAKDDLSESRRRPSDRDGERAKARPSSGSSRSGQGRPSRDDREGSRDRGRTTSSSRSESPSRESRSASGRPSSSRSSQDRAGSREPRQQARDRGQSPRSDQSRDRGNQPPRSGRPSGDEGRRQPPPRRRDDDR